MAQFSILTASCRRVKKRFVLWPLICCIFVYIYIEITFPVRYIFKHSNVSSTCVIPKPDPFDPSILKFVWEPKPLVCDNTPAIVYTDINSVVQFDHKAIKKLNLDKNEITCSYRVVVRIKDDVSVELTQAVEFTPSFQVEADFYRVTCRKNNKDVIFDKLLTGISKQSTKRRVPVQEESLDHPSVFMFGLDSVSRSAAIRKLPKTLRYVTETLGSFDFKGYMKVGENTLPNLLPILTGRRAWTNEFNNTNYSKYPYDDFPFIWKDFENNGYATIYAEDMPKFSTFNYVSRGFVDPPSNHYLRPFWLGIEHLQNVPSELGQVLLYLENKNLNMHTSTMCYKNTPRHKIHIDYLKQYMSAYAKQRKFMFSFMSELCHEYPNFLSYGDEDFLDLFTWLKDNGHLDNAVLILFSDHGSRIDDIRNTYIGRIEVRMPVIHIVIPQKLKEKFPDLVKNLKVNTERLTVPFDLHQTLVDILNNNYKNPGKFYVDGKLRGISLFQQVPAERSCSDAWIPENYCACYTSTPVNVSSNGISKILSEQLVKDINRIVSSNTECAKLSLYKIRDIRFFSDGLEHQRTENTGISIFQFFSPEVTSEHRYDVTIETVPGNGIFEASYSVKGNRDVKLMGDIVRANKYRGQSDCIKDKLLQPLCYCA
ncbi:hypothetical protein ACF0H5_010136 [Mactra antiquata]